MITPEIARHIRRLQIRARRAVVNRLGGEYHSVFKGAGLAFADVRAYQPGDDIRLIDWNVTARMGQPFLKRFVEERELTVLLGLDASASLDVGTRPQTKREVVAELAALIAFAALHNNDRIGLVHCTDRVEHIVPPRKGVRHTQRLLHDILTFRPPGGPTSLSRAIQTLERLQHKRAIVFLFSDYHDSGYERALRLAARRHDLIAVCVRDPLEESLPDVGLLELADAETGEITLVDTSPSEVREAYTAQRRRERLELERTFHRAGVDAIEVSTVGGHLDAMSAFFQKRQQRLKHQ